MSNETHLRMYQAMSYLSLMLALSTLGMHLILSYFRLTLRFGVLVYAFIGFAFPSYVFLQLIARNRVPLVEFMVTLAACGIIIYILMAEGLLRGGAQWLNEHRKKWIKELEYPYILLGVSGVMISINRMEIMDGRVSSIELWGPLIVIAAVAVKLLKIRAEVYEWDNPATFIFD